MKDLRGREGSRTDPGHDANWGGLPGPSGSPGVRTSLQKGPGFHTPAPVSDGLLVLQARLLEETALGCWLASGEGRWEMGTPALK